MYQTTKQETGLQTQVVKKRKSPSLARRVLNTSLTCIVAIGAIPVLVAGKISEL